MIQLSVSFRWVALVIATLAIAFASYEAHRLINAIDQDIEVHRIGDLFCLSSWNEFVCSNASIYPPGYSG